MIPGFLPSIARQSCSQIQLQLLLLLCKLQFFGEGSWDNVTATLASVFERMNSIGDLRLPRQPAQSALLDQCGQKPFLNLTQTCLHMLEKHPRLSPIISQFLQLIGLTPRGINITKINQTRGVRPWMESSKQRIQCNQLIRHFNDIGIELRQVNSYSLTLPLSLPVSFPTQTSVSSCPPDLRTLIHTPKIK
jgi:hypothetical protein